MKKIPFLLIFLKVSFCSLAAENEIVEISSDTLNTSKNFFKEFRILPLPVVYKLPETGFAGGFAASSTFKYAKDAAFSKVSQASFGITYTQNKQLLIFFPFATFFKNNTYYVNGDTGWYKYSYKYFGIGENKIDGELYKVEYPRIRLLAAKLVAKDLYLGFRYTFEHYNITETQSGGELASGEIEGSNFSRTSSLGLAILKDTRDAVLYPRKGFFGEISIIPNWKFLGGQQIYNRVLLDLAKYNSLSKKIVFASHFYGNFIQGNDIPFSQLALLGGPKRMRGILEGKYRDKNLALIEAEFRFEVYKSFGFVTFGSLGFLGNENEFLRLNKPKNTFGVGLRYTALKKDHLNLRIDYALEPSEKGNLYLTIGEAF